jgi:DNA-binding CsgD family transcriptional regulator
MDKIKLLIRCRQYLDEGVELARELGEGWWLCELLSWRAFSGHATGDLGLPLVAAEDGRALAEATGDRFHGRLFRVWVALAHICFGDLSGGILEMRLVIDDAEAAHDTVAQALCLITLSYGLAYQGEVEAAKATADRAIELAIALGDANLDTAYAVSGLAALAAGNPTSALAECAKAWQTRVPEREPLVLSLAPLAEAAAACGDLSEARRWADTAVSKTRDWHLMRALIARVRVAIAQGEPQQAESDAYDALALITDMQAHLMTPDLFESLAVLLDISGNQRAAARLIGASDAMRRRIGVVRFKAFDAAYDANVTKLCTALGEAEFDKARAEGAALSTEEAIAYAQRGRGERKRPASGWESLTPTEQDVVRQVSEGLSNADVATRLFISPRTVQTHLTHVYAKLGLASRVQLVQEAARHA